MRPGFSRKLNLLSCILVVQTVATTAIADVGRTLGSFAVSAQGAATYTIPLFSPPGPNGLAPRIALTYNSQAGNGYLGVGWSLAGFSSISRCNSTYAQDGAPAPVSLTYSDRFCLDGKRLRLASSDNLATYGQAGTTYQTEIADFSNITANGSAGNGPAYFAVQGKDGLTYEYGNGGNSQVLANGSTTAASWLLDKVTDRAGNTMAFSYQLANQTSNLAGTTVPAAISWTPSSHGSSTYNYVINFVYTTLPIPNQSGYVAGTAVQNNQSLSNITISSAGSLVKNYVLGYTPSSASGRQTLTSIKECADTAGTSCLLPTTLAYQPGQTGIGGGTTLTDSSSVALDGVEATYDLNGDGRNDLIFVHADGSYSIAFGGTTGYGSPFNTGVGGDRSAIGDLDGSGQDGFLVAQAGIWWYYKWNGSAFAGTSTTIAVNDSYNDNSVVVADVNGDGLPDLVYLAPDSYIYVQLNTTMSANNVRFAAPIKTIAINGTALQTELGATHKIDFYGSGQQDIIYIGNSSRLVWYDLLHFTGSSFTDVRLGSGHSAGYDVWDIGNYNDDGCLDILDTLGLNISGCSGAVATTLTFGGDTPVGAINWNGDASRAVIVDHGGTLGVYPVTGGQVGNLVMTGIAAPCQDYSGCVLMLPNPTGDGLDGFGVVNPGVSPGTVQYFLHNGAGQAADLLSSVTDGYGNSAAPTYQSIAQGGYTYSLADSTYPHSVYVGPYYAVTQVTASDGTGGFYTQQFSYGEAFEDLQGRGYLGFASRLTYDSRTTFTDTQHFNTQFPYAGTLTDETLTQSDGHKIWEVQNSSWTDMILDSSANNQRYFPYAPATTRYQYEYLGSENGSLISTTQTSYQFDTYGNATSIGTTVTDNDATSPYSGQSWTTSVTNAVDVDTTTWCLPLVTQIQVAYTASGGGAPVTRTRSYTPDLTNCRYTAIVTEPSSPTYEVSEALGYDSFGNINSISRTGAAMTASPATRTTSIAWGATGQFPTSVTDPSGAQTAIGYNYAFGLPANLTDSNTLVTSWAFDAFGRALQETRPDGTYTKWTYADCASAGGCSVGDHAVTLSYEVHGSDNSLITDGGAFYDPTDRVLATTTQLLAGSGQQQLLYQYDSLGRLARRSAPCAPTGSPAVPCTYWTSFSYDGLGRLTSSSRPISASNSTPQTATYQYAGPVSIATDPYNNTKKIVRDVNGWLRQATDAYGYTVTSTYDAAGSKTGIADSLGHSLLSNVTYAYGIAPFRLSTTDARGAWHYVYDALGEKTGLSDGNGHSFSATYDALSRPLTRVEPDLFTQWTWGNSPASDNVGKLQSVCTGGGVNPTTCTSAGYSESDSYDGLGRLSQRSISPTGNVFNAYKYGYSATTGQLNTLTYPVSTSGYALKLQYGYSNGLLQSITDISDSPNVTVWTANAMNPAGQLTQETLGNGIVTSRSYDAVTSWIGAITSGVGGGAGVQNQSYLHDQVGNVTQRQDNNLGLTENFYYDNDYRLSSSSLNGTGNLTLTMNSNGDIASKTDAGPNLQSYAATWTSYNYPNSISTANESVQFTYGPNRERLEQIYNGNAETTFYIGGMLEVATNNVGVSSYRHYIYAGNRPVAIYSRTSTLINGWSYPLSDHQGGVAALTDGTGSVSVEESFSAFGVRRDPSTWVGNPSNSDLTTIAGITRQGYTFQTALGQMMGLNHMNGRVQDAISGRFLSPDPGRADPTDSQTYNRYSYARNNPLTFIDPTGFEDEEYIAVTGDGGWFEVEDDPAEPGMPEGKVSVGDPVDLGPSDNPPPAGDDGGNKGPTGDPRNGGDNIPSGGGSGFAPVPAGGVPLSGGGNDGGGGKSPGSSGSPGGSSGGKGGSGGLPSGGTQNNPWLRGPSGTPTPGSAGGGGGRGPPGAPGSSPGPSKGPSSGPTQCSSSGTAPSPQEFAARGTGLGHQLKLLNSLPPEGAAGGTTTAAWEAATLSQFGRGGSLDAQVLYGGSQAYANYSYGAFMAAAGYSLPESLGYANDYGLVRSTYPQGTVMGRPNYSSIPAVNVTNITAGYDAQKSGTLCTKP